MRNPDPPQDTPAPARDGIFRAIQWLLFLDVVLGLAIAVTGAALLEADSIALSDLGLAVIGLLLMVFFRFLAARETRETRLRRGKPPPILTTERRRRTR